jgi:hypothetical protein
MDKSVNNAASIQFWALIEAKANLARCYIQSADKTGNDAVALHCEGLADLQSQLDAAFREMAASRIADCEKVNLFPGHSFSMGIDIQKDRIEAEITSYDDSKLVSEWSVAVFSDKVHFIRIKNGAKTENYAPVSIGKAAIYATAIVNGLRPPRDLYQCDIPTD